MTHSFFTIVFSIANTEALAMYNYSLWTVLLVSSFVYI